MFPLNKSFIKHYMTHYILELLNLHTNIEKYYVSQHSALLVDLYY